MGELRYRGRKISMKDHGGTHQDDEIDKKKSRIQETNFGFHQETEKGLDSDKAKPYHHTIQATVKPWQCLKFDNGKKQQLSVDQESENFWGNSNFDYGGGGFEDDYDDADLQQALFMSTQCYSEQIIDSDSDSDYDVGEIRDDVKKKGVAKSCSLKRIDYRISAWNNGFDRGESSSGTFCVICTEPKPASVMRRSPCNHYYCDKCIRDYIAERIQENVVRVKCPESKCKQILTIEESFVPGVLMETWKDAILEVNALADYATMQCPFLDCSGVLVDDKRDFLIRACPKCWRILCVKCKVRWHTGMSCNAYQSAALQAPRLLILRKTDDAETEQGQRVIIPIDDLINILQSQLPEGALEQP